jgi:hypothetical protein
VKGHQQIFDTRLSIYFDYTKIHYKKKSKGYDFCKGVTNKNFLKFNYVNFFSAVFHSKSISKPLLGHLEFREWPKNCRLKYIEISVCGKR